MNTRKNWYEHHPEPVTCGPNFTILWDFPIQTDRTIQANRPDIVVKDFLGNVCYLIDMSVPSDKNVSSKTFEKLSKYKDLEIEIGTSELELSQSGKEKNQRISRQNTRQFFSSRNQKIVLSGTAHVLRKALSI